MILTIHGGIGDSASADQESAPIRHMHEAADPVEETSCSYVQRFASG